MYGNLQVYLIYWTPTGTCLASSSGACSLVDVYYKGAVRIYLDGAYNNNPQQEAARTVDNTGSLLAMYPDASGRSVTSIRTADSYVDQRPYPRAATSADPLQQGDVEHEIELAQQYFHLNCLGCVQTNDLSTLYVIFTAPGTVICTSDGCSDKDFCGYHSATGTYIYAVIPNQVSGCTVPEPEPYAALLGTPGGALVDSTVSILSHEMMEAITNPTGRGWYDRSWGNQGGEIGDLCSWTFTQFLLHPKGENLSVRDSDGHELLFKVQDEWDNQSGGCALSAMGPATQDSSGIVQVRTANLLGTADYPN
jgi:hypothetical protein